MLTRSPDDEEQTQTNTVSSSTVLGQLSLYELEGRAGYRTLHRKSQDALFAWSHECGCEDKNQVLRTLTDPERLSY